MEGAPVVRRPPFGDNPTVGSRGASTQRRILDAGLGVFAEHGYHETRVELITEAAGCSRPAFYQYFSSKEDLFWKLAGHLARAMGELAETVEVTTPDADGLAHIRTWLDELIDLSTAYAPIMTGFQAAVRERTPDSGEFRQIGGRLGDAILASAGHDAAALQHGSLANTTVGVTQRAIYYWQVGIGGLSRARFLDGLSQTVHRMLHGPIDDVNVSPVVKAPARRQPKWPEFPSSNAVEQPLRPRGRQTRQTLLDAGRTVLPQRGYHDTRVDDIVEAAGVSHGSFYRYFGNKNDLFHVLAEEAAGHLIDLVASFPDEVDDDGIRRWLTDWFDSYRANGGVISAWQELDHDDPELSAFSIDVAVVVFDRLTRIVHSRGFGDPTVDALALLSVIERVPYSVLVLGHVGEEEAIDASTFLVRRGIFAAD